MTAEDLLAEHDAQTKPKSKAQETAASILAEHDGGAAPAPATLPGAYQGGEGYDFAGSGKKLYDKYIAPEVIPTLASLAATKSPALAIGGRLGMIAAPAFEAGIQGLANYGGEKMNQALGITPVDDTNAAIRGGTAAVTAGLGKAYGMVRPFIGRQGAVTANDAAASDANRMVNNLAPKQNADALFTAATSSGDTIPMSNTVGALQSLLGRPKNGQSMKWAFGPAAEEIKALQQEFRSGTDLSPARWQFLHTRIGQAIGKMSKEGGKGSYEADTLYGAMMTDLEQAANKQMTPQNTGMVSGGSTPTNVFQGGPTVIRPVPGGPALTDYTDVTPITDPRVRIGTTAPGQPSQPSPPSGPTPIPQGRLAAPGPPVTAPGPPSTGASTLLTALQTYKREKSVERLQGYVENATKNLKGQGADIQFNAKTVMDALKKDRFYEGAFTRPEQKDIEATLAVLNQAPNLPANRSVNVGSNRVVQRLSSAAGAGALGASTMGPMEGVAGAAAGYLLPGMLDFAHTLAFTLQTKSGRELIKELAKTKGGVFTPRNFSILSGYVSALKDQPGTEITK